MRAAARIVLALAAVAAVAAGAWLVLAHRGAPSADSASGVSAGPATAPPLAAPIDPALVDPAVAERLSDPLAVPREAVSKAARGRDSLSDAERAAYERYASDVERAVRTDAATIRALVAAYTDTLTKRDAEALASRFAADEGIDPRSAAVARIDSLPTILTGTPQPTVTAYAVGSTTVYVAYSLVVWRDGGIDSEHTIAVPLRKTSSGWRLTALDPVRMADSFIVTTVTGL